MSEHPILQAALDRLQAIVDERRELEAFVATFRKFQVTAAQQPEQPINEAPVPAPSAKAATTQQIVETVMTMLAARGRPMRLAHIYAELMAAGVVVGGKEPRNNLGAKLSAEPRLKTHKDHGWWFTSDAFPEWRLADEDDEGPATDVVGPSYSNGAAVTAA